MIGVKSTIIADNKKQASISTGLKYMRKFTFHKTININKQRRYNPVESITKINSRNAHCSKKTTTTLTENTKI